MRIKSKRFGVLVASDIVFSLEGLFTETTMLLVAKTPNGFAFIYYFIMGWPPL